eukprot:Hpha_TRINITY_DN15471_c5_g6::TRINITY_DN15471_c5_g6_i1::g.176740::m.176740/K08815/TTBK; tau tubulin kinase
MPEPGRKENLPPASTVKPPPVYPPGTVIRKRWEVSKRLGQGAFGETYVGRYVGEDTGKAYPGDVAIKIEKLPDSGHPRNDVLRSEVSVLKKLQGSSRVVELIGSGRDDALGFNFLVMQRLGLNLVDVRKGAPRGMFELPTAARVVRDMLKALQDMHTRGFIHRDVKPSNFVIGRCRCASSKLDDPPPFGCQRLECPAGRVFVIDFGLARTFRLPAVEGSDGVGKHKPPRAKAGFRGTARYASVHSHLEQELSRRDDLWSLFYILVEFVRPSGLPWRAERDRSKTGEKKLTELWTSDRELRSLGSSNPSDLLKGLPVQISSFMEHLASLDYEAEPNYQLLYQYLNELGATEGVLAEWQRADYGYDPDKLAQPPYPKVEEVKKRNTKEVMEEGDAVPDVHNPVEEGIQPQVPLPVERSMPGPALEPGRSENKVPAAHLRSGEGGEMEADEGGAGPMNFDGILLSVKSESPKRAEQRQAHVEVADVEVEKAKKDNSEDVESARSGDHNKVNKTAPQLPREPGSDSPGVQIEAQMEVSERRKRNQSRCGCCVVM